MAKLNLDLEWTDDSKKTVPFVNVGKKVVDLYSSFTIDCVLAWQVYLIKVTVNRLKATECGVFERNDTWSKLCSLLDAIYNDKNDTNPLKKILPKIKNSLRKSHLCFC